MNYVAHTIYTTSKDVKKTVAIFGGLIHKMQLAGMFCDQLPEYHLRAYILE